MTTDTPTSGSEQQQQQAVTTVPDLKSTILEALEISPYDLAVLERLLQRKAWIPDSSDPIAIEDVVFRVRTTYHNGGHLLDFPNHKRLHRLFEVWGNEDIEEWEMEGFHRRSPQATLKLEVERETVKYNAMCTLFEHLAKRKGCTRSSLDITDEQAMELLRTNERLRTIFTNQSRKSTEKETQTLNQKLAEKDAEIAGMLKSLRQ